MACTLSNKCAKNLSKRTVLLQLIIKNVLTCVFGTQCRMVWLPDNEKKIEDMFIRFDKIHERDRRTDRHTHRDGQTAHGGIGRAYA